MNISSRPCPGAARRVRSIRLQRGFSILQVMLALAISSVIAVTQLEGERTRSQLSSGKLQGDVLRLMGDAVNTYIQEQGAALQADKAVSKNGATVPAGTSPGTTMAPTVQQLVAMGYLAPGTSSTATINSGTYRIVLSKIPAGCLGSTCNITGQVYLDSPVRRPGTSEMNGVAVGALLDQLGGDSLVALNSSPGVLRSPSGATVSNPISGAPAGVVGVRVGYGTSGYGNYLVVGDSRDPNFQGNFTVAGNSTFNGPVTTNSTFTAAGGVTTNNISSADGGNVSVNNCFKITADGRVATQCFDPNDLPPGWGGGVRTWDIAAGGSILIAENPGKSTPFPWNSNEASTVITKDNAAEGLVATNGRVLTKKLAFEYGSFSIGSPCTGVTPGTMGRSNDRGSGETLVYCRHDTQTWAPFITSAQDGYWCSNNGMLGIDPSGVAMNCVGQRWMPLNSRMGKWSLTATYMAGNAWTIPKPSCRSGGTPRIVATPQSIDQRNSASNFSARDYGWAWGIVIEDNSGMGVATQAQVDTGCWYE